MMELRWTAKGLSDLARLHEQLAPVNPSAAAALVQEIMRGAERLARFPRSAEALPRYAPREVRRLIVGDYEIRYEIRGATVFLLRLWHCREHR